MYTLIPSKYLWLFFGLLAVSIFVIMNPESADPIILCLTAYKAASLAFIIVLIFGQTPLFPYVCRLPGIRNIFPNLDGLWIATLYSNWPEIAKRLDPPANASTAPKMGKILIVQRFFTIKMILDMDDNYTKSHTIFIRPRRCPLSDRLHLYYIYEAQTKVPVETDSGSHNGAGNLEIKQEAGEIKIDGVYWTNRNWTKGLNTAGHITLERSPK